MADKPAGAANDPSRHGPLSGHPLQQQQQQQAAGVFSPVKKAFARLGAGAEYVLRLLSPDKQQQVLQRAQLQQQYAGQQQNQHQLLHGLPSLQGQQQLQQQHPVQQQQLLHHPQQQQQQQQQQQTQSQEQLSWFARLEHMLRPAQARKQHQQEQQQQQQQQQQQPPNLQQQQQQSPSQQQPQQGLKPGFLELSDLQLTPSRRKGSTAFEAQLPADSLVVLMACPAAVAPC
jgi:hypothetical protein